jgi:hypothetical protein
VPQRAIRRQPSVEGGDARASGHHHSRSASLTGGVHGNLTGRSLLRALQQPLLATEAIDGSGGGGGGGGSDKSAAVASRTAERRRSRLACAQTASSTSARRSVDSD